MCEARNSGVVQTRQCLLDFCAKYGKSLSSSISSEYSGLLQNKLPLPGGETIDSIFSGSFPSYEKIEHGFDFPGINSIFQQGEGTDFPKIGSVFGENSPFQKTDKSKIANADKLSTR